MKEQIVQLLIENVVGEVFALISVLFTVVILPWVKNSVIPWLKEKHIYGSVEKLVMAAEKLAESGTIEKIDKKAYVVSMLEKSGVEISEAVDAYIEAAVKQLDIETAKIVKSAKESLQEGE